MAKRPSAPKSQKKVETLRHPDDKRLNIPTAEHQSVLQAPPTYIQEKVHSQVHIDDLLQESKGAKAQKSGAKIDPFADFNGVADGADRTDYYQHDQNWTNRMILGDSIQVMASLAERE